MAPRNGSKIIQELHKCVHEQVHRWVHLGKPQSSHNDIAKPLVKWKLVNKELYGPDARLTRLKTGDPSVFRVFVASLHFAFWFSLMLRYRRPSVMSPYLPGALLVIFFN